MSFNELSGPLTYEGEQVVNEEALVLMRVVQKRLLGHVSIAVLNGPGELYSYNGRQQKRPLNEGEYLIEIKASFRGYRAEPFWDEYWRLKGR